MALDEEQATRLHLPGDLLLHPAIIVSLGLLLLNDLYLKSAQPGPVSGKLSDFAGLALVPALIFALSELVASAARRRRVLLTHSWMWLFAALTAVTFTLIKTVPWAGDVAERANDFIIGPMMGSHGPTVFTADPTDLLALPAVLVAIWVSGRVRD